MQLLNILSNCCLSVASLLGIFLFILLPSWVSSQSKHSFTTVKLHALPTVWIVFIFFPHSRATQYACMMLSYMLEHKTGREKLVLKLKNLESSMSSGRKCKYVASKDVPSCPIDPFHLKVRLELQMPRMALCLLRCCNEKQKACCTEYKIHLPLLLFLKSSF